MTLQCREIDDLLAAYVLQAVDDQSRCAVNEHLADCRRHDAEIEGLRATAGQLALTAPTVAPPDGLKDLLLNAFRSDVRVSAGGSRMEVAARPAPPMWRRLSFAYGLAAALAIIALALGALTLSGEAKDGVRQAIVRTVDRDNMHLRLIYLPEQSQALVAMDMPELPANRTYQLWQVTAAGPKSIRLMPAKAGEVLKVDLSQATALAVSVEPLGGSSQPTNEPVVVISLLN